MPAVRILPDVRTMQRWIEDEGLSHQEVADRISEDTGHKIARSTVSAAMSRAGLSGDQVRYEEEIPWRVQAQHLREYPVRMLRLLGRKRHGMPLKPEEALRLENWLELLKEENAVVAYDPTARTGFAYVERKDTDPVDIPIRRQTVTFQY